jgi:hypothetical protein
MGLYSLSSAERGVTLTQEEFPAVNASVACAASALQPFLKVSCNRFGGWHTVTTSCTQVSKRLVAHIKALLVLSPSGYWRPSDSHIAKIADAHFTTALASLNILLDVEFKAYMERKAGKFFQAYGFDTQEGKKDEEAAAAAAAATGKALAAAAAEEAQPKRQLLWLLLLPAHLATVLIEAY